MTHRRILTCLFVLPLAGCSVTDSKVDDSNIAVTGASGGASSGAAGSSGAASTGVAGSSGVVTGVAGATSPGTAGVGNSSTAGAASSGAAGAATTAANGAGATGAGATGAGATGAGATGAGATGAGAAGAAGAGATGAGAAGAAGADATGAAGAAGAGAGAGATDGTGGAGASDVSSGGAPADDAGGAGNMDSGQPSVAPEASGEEIPCDREFDIPSFDDLSENPKMPDPFTFLDGSKVESKADWVCRQKEISLLAQAFIYGPKPGKPESLTASFSNGELSIDIEDGGRSFSFSVDIDVPSGDGPHPALFSIDEGAPSGVAEIDTGLSWLSGTIANAGSGRGIRGGFYDLYPDSEATGSLMAWAWAASRIIDALEITDGHNIDTTKMYGLGCSRNGKAAATMALFDRRMAMVGMHSPGSGSTSGWRPAEASSGNVQTADQIYGETTWMGEAFGEFGRAVDRLPVDQHTVLALAWPRPLIVREGTNDSWNCPECVYTTLKYTQLIYEALGDKDAVGFTHYNGGHCEGGGSEWRDLYEAFVDRYIFGDESVSTEGMFTESFTFDADKWQDGDLPALP